MWIPFYLILAVFPLLLQTTNVFVLKRDGGYGCMGVGRGSEMSGRGEGGEGGSGEKGSLESRAHERKHFKLRWWWGGVEVEVG